MRQQIENVRDGLKAADRTLVHCREIIAAYRKAIDDAGMRVYYLPKGGGMALCKKEEEETPPNDALPTTPVPAGLVRSAR